MFEPLKLIIDLLKTYQEEVPEEVYGQLQVGLLENFFDENEYKYIKIFQKFQGIARKMEFIEEKSGDVETANNALYIARDPAVEKVDRGIGVKTGRSERGV